MGAHELCLDFEGEAYPGKEGRKLHGLGYKVLGPCLRFSLDTDIDELMHTEDESQLAEAQERMYKSDTQHTWNHMMETEREIRTLIYNNTTQINDHIKATTGALANLHEGMSALRANHVDTDAKLRQCVEEVVQQYIKGGGKPLTSDSAPMSQTLQDFQLEFTQKLVNQNTEMNNRMNLLKQQMNDYLSVESIKANQK